MKLQIKLDVAKGNVTLSTTQIPVKFYSKKPLKGNEALLQLGRNPFEISKSTWYTLRRTST